MAERMMITRRTFDEHLDECARCCKEPMNLCPVGAHLLRTTAMALLLGLDDPSIRRRGASESGTKTDSEEHR